MSKEAAVRPAVYAELQSFVESQICGKECCTLNPRQLLMDFQSHLNGQARGLDQARLFALAAPVIRRFVIDLVVFGQARNRNRQITLVMDDELLDAYGQNLDLLRLDEVVDYLELSDPRLARVAELRLFGGLTPLETAAVLGVSAATVDSDWAKARSWLLRALQNGDHHGRSVAFGFVSRFNTLRHLRPTGVA